MIQAGQFLKIDGFDSFPSADGVGQRMFARTLPFIYTSWAKALPRALENVKGLIEAELDCMLENLSMDRESLAQTIHLARQEVLAESTKIQHKCLVCIDDYVNLGTGLVQPRKVSFNECRTSNHKPECQCAEYLRTVGIVQGPPQVSGGDIDDGDVDGEYFQDTEDDVQALCEAFDKLGVGEVDGDYFHETATMLYRAQGRRWVGLYEPLELLCSSFLEGRIYWREWAGRATPFYAYAQDLQCVFARTSYRNILSHSLIFRFVIFTLLPSSFPLRDGFAYSLVRP